MNKLILNILFTIVILSIYSCARENKSEDMTSIATETEESISADEYTEMESMIESKPTELTKEQKEAFQLRAIQKVQDFLDYVKIISDSKVDKRLKDHSAKLSIELFVSDSILITDSILTDSAVSVPLKNYLTVLKSKKTPVYIKTEKLHFSEPLTADSLNNYKGIIEAKIKIKGHSLTKNIEVFLTEIDKNFGENKKDITEVRLGNIY